MTEQIPHVVGSLTNTSGQEVAEVQGRSKPAQAALDKVQH